MLNNLNFKLTKCQYLRRTINTILYTIYCIPTFRPPCTFLIISRSIILRPRNVSDKFVQKIKAHILCSVTFFPSENRTVYETMWKNIAQPDRPQKTIEYSACALHAGQILLQTHT